MADAALGGTQFTGQADLTLTLAQIRARSITRLADGTSQTLSRFVLRLPKSGRGDLLNDVPEYFEVRGTRDADKAMCSLELDHPNAEPTIDERAIAILSDGPLGRGALAEKLEINQTGSSFRNLLTRLLESHTIAKNADELYELVSHS